ncbi:MAG: phosphoenolpyruvate carboxylase, partial [Calditrichaeota bacterium]|nr:phosphoenolpyruvate carboxylase [Calditrichota bacterium]
MQDWKGILVDAEGTGVSPHFSKHVNLLGSLLGHSIREQLGDDIFHKVEELRRLCKAAYQPGKEQHREDALALIRSLTNDEILWLLRSFTAFFRLVNNAEKHEIFRVNHERERAASTDEPRTESIADAIHRFKVA